MTNGEIIRAAREEKKLSLRACARELGISATYLHHIETGRCPLPETRAARFVDVLSIASGALTFGGDALYALAERAVQEAIDGAIDLINQRVEIPLATAREAARAGQLSAQPFLIMLKERA